MFAVHIRHVVVDSQNQQTATFVWCYLTLEVMIWVIWQYLLPLACQVIEGILIPNLIIRLYHLDPLLNKGQRLLAEQHDACR